MDNIGRKHRIFQALCLIRKVISWAGMIVQLVKKLEDLAAET